MNDAGYDIVHDFDGVLEQFDKLLGLNQIAVVHLNDSKNPMGARKDRHENLGFGTIGFDALYRIAHHKALEHVPENIGNSIYKSETDPKQSFPSL